MVERLEKAKARIPQTSLPINVGKDNDVYGITVIISLIVAARPDDFQDLNKILIDKFNPQKIPSIKQFIRYITKSPELSSVVSKNKWWWPF